MRPSGSRGATRLASARTIAPLSMPSCVEEVLVLGGENRVDEERRDVGRIVDQDAVLGRGNAGDRLEILGDEHRLLGEVGAIAQARDGAGVDAQVVVDVLRVAGVDLLDDRLELDVGDHREDREDADQDEKAPHEPAEEPDDGPDERHRPHPTLLVPFSPMSQSPDASGSNRAADCRCWKKQTLYQTRHHAQSRVPARYCATLLWRNIDDSDALRHVGDARGRSV